MKKTKKKKEFRTTIGGQALIEGIMMRGPKKQAIAVRTKDEIVVKTDPLKLTKDKYKIAGWPFIRGVINFGTSMSAGVRAIMYTADLAFEDDETAAESKFDKWIEEKLGSEKAERVIITIALVLGIGMSIGLFMLLPTLIAGLFTRWVDSRVFRNLLEGALRIIIFVGYIGLSSLMREMRRMWQYHGAEHKAVYCYERGLELTAENVRAQSRLHPRCGTSFLFIVMIVSILMFSVVSWQGVILRVVFRLLLLPLVVSVSYELIKLAGRFDNPLTRIISAPGKALQHLTTREPDDAMIEVAIAAIKEVIPEKKGEDDW